MKIGMLWFAGAAPLWEQIDAATARYAAKYGTPPDTAYVNPRDLAAAPERPAGCALEIRTKDTIMPRHIWIGVSRTPVPANANQ